MALLDRIKDGFNSIIPQKSSPPPRLPPPSGFGTAGGAGTARFEEDDVRYSPRVASIYPLFSESLLGTHIRFPISLTLPAFCVHLARVR